MKIDPSRISFDWTDGTALFYRGKSIELTENDKLSLRFPSMWSIETGDDTFALGSAVALIEAHMAKLSAHQRIEFLRGAGSDEADQEQPGEP